jgi:hypothetical protein
MKLRTMFVISVLLAVFVLPVQAQRAEGRTSVPTVGPRAPVGGTNPPSTSVRDGGFEGSYDASTFYMNDDWRVNDTMFDSPICKIAGCGENATYGAPRSGTHWAYFGAVSAAETGFVQQKVILPDTAFLQLEYYVWLSFLGATPTFTVSVDGDVVDTLPASLTGGYVLRTVDLTPYADGRVHRIRFSYTKPAGGFADINLDDISLYKGESITVFGPGFESDLDWWTVVNKTGDKVVCNTATATFSRSGNCAFRFKGSVGENSQLKQSYGVLRRVPAAGYRAPPAFALYLGAFIDAPASVRGTMKLTLTLTDSSKVKAKVALSGSGNYKWIQTPYITYPSEQGIIAILIGLIHRSESGKTYLDDFEIFEVADYS